MKPIRVHYSSSRHYKTLGLNKVIGTRKKQQSLVCRMNNHHPCSIPQLQPIILVWTDTHLKICVRQLTYSFSTEHQTWWLQSKLLYPSALFSHTFSIRFHLLVRTSAMVSCTYYNYFLTRVINQLQKGFNSIIILGAWLIWKHRNQGLLGFQGGGSAVVCSRGLRSVLSPCPDSCFLVLFWACGLVLP